MKPVIVIKQGGSSLSNSATLAELAALVRGYRKRRYQVVVVHGGGPAINAELTKRGIQWKFIDGQRQTTPEMIDVIDQVLAQDVNGAVVESLSRARIHAAGMSGAHGILFCSQASPELMRVGKIGYVDVAPIEAQLARFGSPTPVIAPIGIGDQGEKYNINADWAATQIAIALGAKRLIFLTDQNGILDGEKNLIQKATPRHIEVMIEDGVISGGMMTKTRAMMAALQAGVKKVLVLNAAFASHLLTENKIGTLLTDSKASVAGERNVLHERAS
ncbi:MAG: acetylglutamate kinase [Bdellovibrionia bacterium]